jgi:hypothetical protein
MKSMTALIGVIAVLLSGCSADRQKVRNVLEADGCTQTEVGGWTLFGCGKEDFFTNTFACTKNGRHVNGLVCSGFLKGFTVRYE